MTEAPHRVRAHTVRRVGLGALGLALAVLLWDLSVRYEWVNPAFLVAPGTVAENLVDGWTEPTLTSSPLATETAATVVNFALGFGLAIVIGVIAGAILGLAGPIGAYSDGVVRLFQYTPPVVILPLLIVYLDRGQMTIAAYIVVASVWPILIHTREAIQNRDALLEAAARSVGWNGHRLFTHVILPQIASEVGVGVRIASVIALISTIFGEFLAGDSGLGFEILLAKQGFRYGEMYPAIVTLAVTGFAINMLFRHLQGLATGWQRHGAIASDAARPA